MGRGKRRAEGSGGGREKLAGTAKAGGRSVGFRIQRKLMRAVLPILLCLKDNFVGAGHMINSAIFMAGERALLIENMQLNIDFGA